MPFARQALFSSACAFALATVGCEQKPAQPLAPEADALATPSAASAGAARLDVVPESSKVDFEMDAELERIFGRAPGSVQGELFIDQKELGKSSGLIKVDLFKLTMSQRKRKSKDEDYGEERTVDKQLKDAHAWLQISDDAPEAEREKNRWVEFKLEKFESATPSDLGSLGGAERKATAVVSGTFRLHGRATQKRAKVEATFKYQGDTLQSVFVKTLEPVAVGLEEHDIRPRKGFAVLADTTLEALGAKVAKVALVSFEFEATAK